MASKYLSGVCSPTGYTLTGLYSSITIGPAAYIDGPLRGGTAQAYGIVNLGGRVTGGVTLLAGGTITNGTPAARRP